MPRYTDNAPIKNTCPIINDVVRIFESFKSDIKITDDDDLPDFIADCDNGLSILEDIRTANQTLRDWGNEECTRANELEKDLDRLQSKYDELQMNFEESEYQRQMNQ